jgi:nucleotide-binding universal stress UspA family protein
MKGPSVLLLVDPVHPAPDAVARAVEAARGEALTALAVIDPESLGPVEGRIAEIGFVGAEQRREVREALYAEHREQAALRIGEIRAAAEAAHIPFEGVVRDGELVATALAEIRAREAKLVIVPSRRRSRLARLLGESRLDVLEAQAACPFEYVAPED